MSRAPRPAGVAPRASDRVPERRRVLVHDHQLDAVLARVAGAVDHALDAVELAHRQGERRRLVEPEPLQRTGALDGQQRVAVGDVARVRAADLAVPDPLEVGLPVRGVDDEQVAAFLEAVHDQVVDDAAGLVREQRVLSAADVDLVEVVREERLEELARLRPLDLELAHVRDVEDAAVLADGAVLGDDPLVLDRHLPAGERHHARAERDVALVERRSEQRLHARRMLMTGGRHRLERRRPARAAKRDERPARSPGGPDGPAGRAERLDAPTRRIPKPSCRSPFFTVAEEGRHFENVVRDARKRPRSSAARTCLAVAPRPARLRSRRRRR